LFAKSSPNKANDEKQDDRPNCRNGDSPNNRIAYRDGNSEAREQITRHSRSENANNDITDKPKPTALHDKASKETGNGADYNPDYNGLWFHWIPPDYVLVCVDAMREHHRH
jgi:hypothetical protein